jgi:dipeptidyl aminopeptidase/acylaminoacyl peptidase
VISSRGGGARILTPDDGDDRNAAWSPDGRLIAFASNRDGDFEIFSTRANGKDPTQLTRNAATESIPDWQRLVGGQRGSILSDERRLGCHNPHDQLRPVSACPGPARPLPASGR